MKKMLYSYHRGQYLQRGKGLGGIFSALARWLKPILPKILSLGKRTMKDPVVKDAVHKIKNEAINAGSRAINKKLQNIAPLNSQPSKKRKKVVKKASKNITVASAKKQINNSLLKTNKITKDNNNDKNIFNEMK